MSYIYWYIVWHVILNICTNVTKYMIQNVASFTSTKWNVKITTASINIVLDKTIFPE